MWKDQTGRGKCQVFSGISYHTALHNEHANVTWCNMYNQKFSPCQCPTQYQNDPTTIHFYSQTQILKGNYWRISQIPKPSIPSAQLCFGAFVRWPASSGGPKTSTSGQDQRMISTTCCLVGKGNIGGTTWGSLPHTIMVQCRIGVHDYRRKTNHGKWVRKKDWSWIVTQRQLMKKTPPTIHNKQFDPLFLYTFMGLFVQISCFFLMFFVNITPWRVGVGPPHPKYHPENATASHTRRNCLSLFTSNLFKWLGYRGFISCTVVHQLTCDEAYDGNTNVEEDISNSQEWWQSESISN